jgi:membrane fusion protein, multidrug efflux system
MLVIGMALFAYFKGSRPRALPKPPQEKVWTVALIEAARRDLRPDIRAFGQIRAGREAEIRAMVAGRLVELNPEFRDGALIRAGMLLAVIDPVDYEIRLAEQRAELAQAGSLLGEYERELEWESKLLTNAGRQVELARRGLERATKLASSGRESKKGRDDAEIQLAVAEQTELQKAQATARLAARIEQQRAAFQRAQALLASAERDLAHTRVVAPFEGHSADVRLALGKLVAVGESLGRLLAADELEARFEIPEADFSRLLQSDQADHALTALIGRKVEIIWRLGDRSLRFDAEIARIGAEIDAAMGGIEMFAVLDGDASAVDIEYRSVFLLPSKAVSDDGLAYVFDGERLQPVEVRVLRKMGGELVVEAPFDDGAKVVANQFAGIGPGIRARAR